MPTPPRVLIIAEAANPEWASVPLVGWSLASALFDLNDAHIVTHIRNRDAIIKAGLIEGRDFTAIDNEYLASALWKAGQVLRGGGGKGWTTSTAIMSLAYYSFEHELWRLFSKRIRAREYDVVHRITPLTPTAPSILARKVRRAGVPFIIGPLNGGLPWPKSFLSRQHAEREWLSHVRSAYKLLPGYRSTRRDSAAIIVGSQHTLSEIPDSMRARCVYIPENGIDPLRFQQVRVRSAKLPLNAIFVGRLVPYKGADILIRAAVEYIRANLINLQIVGDGPQKADLVDLVAEMGISDRVIFHGWVPHRQVAAHLQNCDLLALPSVREFGGGVVLEAMALGVAPVVADYGGPSELVDNECGIRVPFEDQTSLEQNLRVVLESIVKNPGILDRLGRAARMRCLDEFSWTAKAARISRIYDAVLKGQEDLQALGLDPAPPLDTKSLFHELRLRSRNESSNT